MTYLLMLHIFLGVGLILAFVARYLGVLTKRISPKTGRGFIGGLTIALLTSGVALIIVAKQPLSNACIAALGIIFVVIFLEIALQYLIKKTVPTIH